MLHFCVPPGFPGMTSWLFAELFSFQFRLRTRPRGPSRLSKVPSSLCFSSHHGTGRSSFTCLSPAPKAGAGGPPRVPLSYLSLYPRAVPGTGER